MASARAPFDPRTYEDEVIKPLRRRLPHLPDDLPTRYAVDPDMDAARLRERTDAVVRLWAKIAQRAGQSGLVCAQLLREHDELTRSPGVDLADPRWWQRREQERARQLGPEIAALAAVLTAGHGELGVITEGQLRAAAAAHGTLGDTDLDRARSAAGLRIVAPVPLPLSAVMRGRFDSLARSLVAAGVDSIPRLLFPALTAFGLLRRFTVTPVPAGRSGALGASAIVERAQELDTLPDSASVRAAREAVGMLASEAAAGTDLTALCLFHLLGPVREKRADGAGARTLYGLLTRTGLDPGEAGRLAVSVLAEPGGRPDPVGPVERLLAEGRVVAAQQAADRLTGPQAEAARAAVRHRLDEVERLRFVAAEDLRAGEHGRAGQRLREARRQATDLPGLAAELDRVPAGAVVEVTARADGGGVRISWRPAAEHAADTAFRVVRGVGDPPGDADDGTVVAEGSGESAFDHRPPPGRPLYYTVFARTPSGPWSRPAVAGELRVVPPVSDVVVEGGVGAIEGRWQVDPDVIGVEVRRRLVEDAGPVDPIPVDRHRSFRDETAVDGVRYLYSIVAVHPPVRPDARPLRSEPVTVSGATRPEPRPVRSLSAVALGGADRLAVRLSWRQPPGSEIVVRAAARPCPWGYGHPVTDTDMREYGTELDGIRGARGDGVTLVAELSAGRVHLVPFTLGPAGGIRGQDAVVDLIPPVSRLRAQSFGADVLLSWSWPEAVHAAVLEWAGGSRRITRTRYREEGGCLLRAVPGGTRIDVSALLLPDPQDPVSIGAAGAVDEARSPAVSVDVDRRPPQIGYQLRRRGNRLTGGVRCTVTLSGTEPVTGLTVVVIAAPGPVMPGSAAAGTELLRAPVRIEPGVPVQLEAAVPALRRPYWLRCFLAEPAGALLVDPPVDQLKVP